MRLARATLEEGVVLVAVTERAMEIREREAEVLAELITEKVVTAWNKGQAKAKSSGKGK